MMCISGFGYLIVSKFSTIVVKFTQCMLPTW